jgi:hypothetical protein
MKIWRHSDNGVESIGIRCPEREFEWEWYSLLQCFRCCGNYLSRELVVTHALTRNQKRLRPTQVA